MNQTTSLSLLLTILFLANLLSYLLYRHYSHRRSPNPTHRSTTTTLLLNTSLTQTLLCPFAIRSVLAHLTAACTRLNWLSITSCKDAYANAWVWMALTLVIVTTIILIIYLGRFIWFVRALHHLRPHNDSPTTMRRMRQEISRPHIPALVFAHAGFQTCWLAAGVLGHADVVMGEGAEGSRRFGGSCAGVVVMLVGYGVGVLGGVVEVGKGGWEGAERWGGGWRRRRRG
ncbi:MAG: hypothetical protein OHK93_006794 [Ramalina farinacea]|uniref:Uncharacterized protein n=1 Tax=Ramalina farinacea TaxID=258253 RepID=A0AA43QKX5_9LECA|nr:hypothetical protein [Ramalina farinacea]